LFVLSKNDVTTQKKAISRELNSFFPPVAQQPNSGLRQLIVDVSRSHTIRYTLPVGLLWNEWSASRRGRYVHCTQQTQEKNIMLRRDSDPQSQ